MNEKITVGHKMMVVKAMELFKKPLSVVYKKSPIDAASRTP